MKLLLYIYICSAITISIRIVKDIIDDFRETHVITKEDMTMNFLLWGMTGLSPVFNTWFALLVIYDSTKDIINYLKK